MKAIKGKLLPVSLGLCLFSILIILQVTLGSDRSNTKNSEIQEKSKKAYEKFFTEEKLELINGSKRTLSSYKEPIVLLNFWATWCTPCIKEFKSMKKLQDKFGHDKFHIVGVNCDEDKKISEIRRFKKKHKLNFQSVMDPKTKLLDNFSLTHIPASIMYHKGKVIYFSNKYTDFLDDNIVERVKSVLE